MKITRVSATATSTRRATPIRDALQVLDTRGITHITIESSEGVSGVSSTYFGRVDKAPAVLAHLVNDVLGPAIVGDDPAFIRWIRDKLWQLTDYHGSQGLALFGIAGIDIALWDLMGKAMGQPVWRLLGAQRDRVPAYAMVGWLNYSLDEIKGICEQAMTQGFRGVKMKVGAPTLEEDITRIEAVQSVVGRKGLIMVDANQVFSLNEALRRAGGFTECLEIGLMADAFNVPYASHGGGVHLHVLAALPNTLFMESGLLPADSSIRLVDGCYPLPETPGFGGSE